MRLFKEHFADLHPIQIAANEQFGHLGVVGVFHGHSFVLNAVAHVFFFTQSNSGLKSGVDIGCVPLGARPV